MPPLTRSMKTKQQQQQQQKQSRKRKAPIEPQYPKVKNNVEYPENKDGTLMTPLDFYDLQFTKSDGFDVDETPDNWKFPGQIRPAVDNTLSEELARFAIEDHNNKKGSKEQLEYIEILKAMVNSCSGKKYRLTFNVKKIDDGCVKTCQAIVICWWHGLREVISFGDMQEASSVGSNSKTLASVPEKEAGPISQGGSTIEVPGGIAARIVGPLSPRTPLLLKSGVTKESSSSSDSGSDGTPSNIESELIISRYEIVAVRTRANSRLKRKLARLAAPTDDKEVQALLQRLRQPMSLSTNETDLQRRHRLRVVMGILSYQGQFKRLLKGTENDSIVRVHHAIDDDDDGSYRRIDWQPIGQSHLPNEDLPISGCSLSHDGQLHATCDSSLSAQVRKRGSGNVCTLVGHKDGLTDVTFSPSEKHIIATGSADCTAKLWETKKDDRWSLLKTFEGHKGSLGRIAFHPSGKFLGTTSVDKSWRLWDIDTGCELLCLKEDDHAIRRIAFHCGGSLAASDGMDNVARVWDLRTRGCLFSLQGHVKPISGISFSPNGYYLATGGEDSTLRIWDLRKGKSCYTKPAAHSDIISQVKFEPQEGRYLFTGSHDETVKVWYSGNFKLVRTLSFRGKVEALDVVKDAKFAAVAHRQTLTILSADKY